MPDVNVSPVGALDDEQVQQAAVKRIKRLPGWFDIGEADALAWHDIHIDSALPVESLDEANQLLLKQAQMNKKLIVIVLALRDAVLAMRRNR